MTHCLTFVSGNQWLSPLASAATALKLIVRLGLYYRESRSEEQLKEKLRQYHGLVAMAAGLFKDAATETLPSVESPISARNDFEQLDAEDWREFGSKLGPGMTKPHG